MALYNCMDYLQTAIRFFFVVKHDVRWVHRATFLLLPPAVPGTRAPNADVPPPHPKALYIAPTALRQGTCPRPCPGRAGGGPCRAREAGGVPLAMPVTSIGWWSSGQRASSWHSEGLSARWSGVGPPSPPPPRPCVAAAQCHSMERNERAVQCAVQCAVRTI